MARELVSLTTVCVNITSTGYVRHYLRTVLSYCVTEDQTMAVRWLCLGLSAYPTQNQVITFQNIIAMSDRTFKTTLRSCGCFYAFVTFPAIGMNIERSTSDYVCWSWCLD